MADKHRAAAAGQRDQSRVVRLCQAPRVSIGADISARIGNPVTTAFCTVSKEQRLVMRQTPDAHSRAAIPTSGSTGLHDGNLYSGQLIVRSEYLV